MMHAKGNGKTGKTPSLVEPLQQRIPREGNIAADPLPTATHLLRCLGVTPNCAIQDLARIVLRGFFCCKRETSFGMRVLSVDLMCILLHLVCPAGSLVVFAVAGTVVGHFLVAREAEGCYSA